MADGRSANGHVSCILTAVKMLSERSKIVGVKEKIQELVTSNGRRLIVIGFYITGNSKNLSKSLAEGSDNSYDNYYMPEHPTSKSTL